MGVSIALLVLAAVLWLTAFLFDEMDRSRAAAVLAVAGAAVFAAMLATLPDTGVRPDTEVPGPLTSTTPQTEPTPTPVPSYDAATCADLAWLNGHWQCIPFEEQG
jgi:hypothetical protein